MGALTNSILALMLREIILDPVSPIFKASVLCTNNNFSLGCALCLDQQDDSGNSELPYTTEYTSPD